MKLICPYCGRCLGECNSSDKTATCKVLIKAPQHLKKKHFIHDMNCVKCKEKIYIVMEFVD